MKKYLMILAAAAALVACSKNEVIPEVVNNDAEAEITYLTAPKVRADVKDFDKAWKFKSYAFYLPSAETWASHTTAPTEYIKDVEISYNTTDNAWRNATKKYYWPKSGKLTFFAWTNVKESRFVPTSPTSGPSTSYTFSSDNYISGVTVDATNGVKVTDYDVTATANKNMDVLVADINADQTNNLTNDYGDFGKTDKADRIDKRETRYTGVATLFKHKLSKVYFTGKTDKNYTKDGVTFYVNSIVFNNIAKQGTYTQVVDATKTGSWATVKNTTDAQYYYSGQDGVSGYDIPSDTTVEDIFDNDSQYYYMPQTFGDDAEFVVTYSIDYGNGVKEENIKQVCKLKASTLNAFEIGKFYTINLIFTLNEILWDPAVQEWETGSANVTVNQ